MGQILPRVLAQVAASTASSAVRSCCLQSLVKLAATACHQNLQQLPLAVNAVSLTLPPDKPESLALHIVRHPSLLSPLPAPRPPWPSDVPYVAMRAVAGSSGLRSRAAQRQAGRAGLGAASARCAPAVRMVSCNASTLCCNADCHESHDVLCVARHCVLHQ
jgi:hypothetical protein